MNMEALDCLKCGGTLEITPDIEILKCPYCGMNHFVERSQDTVKLVQIARDVDALKDNVDIIKNGLRAIEEIKKLPPRRILLEANLKGASRSYFSKGVARALPIAFVLFFLGVIALSALGFNEGILICWVPVVVLIGLVIAAAYNKKMRKGTQVDRDAVSAQLAELAAKETELEDQIRRYKEWAGHDTEDDSEILTLIRQGRRIEAIKRVRAESNVGLEEAMQIVEMLADEHGIGTS